MLAVAVCFGVYVLWIRCTRYRRRDRLSKQRVRTVGGIHAERLSPNVAFFGLICHVISACVAEMQEFINAFVQYEMPILGRISVAFAFLHTFAIPSISRLLHKTQHFAAAHGPKRIDDTFLLLSELAERGLVTERGRVAVRRILFMDIVINLCVLFVLFRSFPQSRPSVRCAAAQWSKQIKS